MKLVHLNKRKDIRVHAPRFPKPKDESWFLTMGSIETKELLALKRFTFGRRKEVFHNFIYQVPNILGECLVRIFIIVNEWPKLTLELVFLMEP